jgi:hypothetical protein
MSVETGLADRLGPKLSTYRPGVDSVVEQMMA